VDLSLLCRAQYDDLSPRSRAAEIRADCWAHSFP